MTDILWVIPGLFLGAVIGGLVVAVFFEAMSND